MRLPGLGPPGPRWMATSARAVAAAGRTAGAAGPAPAGRRGDPGRRGVGRCRPVWSGCVGWWCQWESRAATGIGRAIGMEARQGRDSWGVYVRHLGQRTGEG